jgi:CRISPR/Cas system CSM-associated protein Csm2 small subunit
MVDVGVGQEPQEEPEPPVQQVIPVPTTDEPEVRDVMEEARREIAAQKIGSALFKIIGEFKDKKTATTAGEVERSVIEIEGLAGLLKMTLKKDFGLGDLLSLLEEIDKKDVVLSPKAVSLQDRPAANQFHTVIGKIRDLVSDYTGKDKRDLQKRWEDILQNNRAKVIFERQVGRRKTKDEITASFGEILDWPWLPPKKKK